MSNLKDFALGKSGTLTLKGPAPARVTASLRTLEGLGILTNDLAWELMARAQVDPFFLIRSILQYREALPFQKQTQVVGEDYVFCAGPRNPEGPKVAYHVNVFTNDVTLMVRDIKGEYYSLLAVSGMDMFHSISEVPVGEARVQKLIDLIKSQVAEGFAYR